MPPLGGWFYILRGKTPVAVEDVLTWGKWFEEADRRVAKTMVGEVQVSTVFIGLDHSFGGFGPPLVFETMIFGGPFDGYTDRCATWEEAEAMHKLAVKKVRRAVSQLKVVNGGGDNVD